MLSWYAELILFDNVVGPYVLLPMCTFLYSIYELPCFQNLNFLFVRFYGMIVYVLIFEILSVFGNRY